MIIKSIAIENFQCYYGGLDKNKFEFRKGLNVVIGDNGSGKSKLYDAFFWVLNDKVFDSTTRELFHTSATNINIVSDKAKSECKVGGKITTRVMIHLVDYKDHSTYSDEYILERSYTIQRVKDGADYTNVDNWKIPANSITTIEKKDVIDFKPMFGNESFDRIVQKLIPSDMSQYLWFQGEQVDSLIDFKKESSLTQAINVLSDINYYDTIIQVAEKVYKQAEAAFKSELREKSKNENEARELAQKQETLDKLIARDEEDLLKIKENLQNADETKEDLLGKISDAKELEQLKSDLRNSKEKINRIDMELEQARKGFNANLFSKHWLLRNAGPIFTKFEHLWNDYESTREDLKVEHKIKQQQEEAKKHRLPENVPNASYLYDMLKEKHCFLCDRKFEENDHAHQYLSDLFEKTKSTRVTIKDIVVNDFKPFFQQLYNNGFNLNANSIGSVDASIASELEKIDKLEEQRKDALNGLSLLEKKMMHLHGTSSITEDESRDIVRKFQQYDQDKEKFQKQKFEIEYRIERNRAELADILEKMKGNLGDSINPDTIEKKEVLEKFYEIAKSTREMVYEEQVRRIEEEANKHFLRMTSENKSVQGKIILKKHGANYMPKNVDEYGYELSSINDSNIILIKLSTIMAIVTARGKSEFHPLISDAPTSKFGDNYTIGFCNTIDDVFTMSIIFSKDFYHNLTLRNRLLNEVDNLGAVYVIEPSIKEEDRTNRVDLSTKITLLN
ncbi:MAG: AAA family ATPase [Bacteroidales bacterium]|nr:AAA family ATPase [Bacteroidales bacterium]